MSKLKWKVRILAGLMRECWQRLLTEDEGASLTEYGLLIALIAAVCVTAVTLLGSNLAGIFNTMAGAV
ncbi:MAG: Flp family type IVb pilin [Planctomycetota bacterium]